MKYFLFFLLILSISGCESITGNELKGLNDITTLYGGKCSYSLSDDGDKKVMNLELNGSPSVDLFTNLQVPTSNVAFLYYHSMAEEEREKYTHIKVKVQKKAGEFIRTDEYATSTLDTLEKQAVMFDQFMFFITKGNYQEMFRYMNPEKPENKNEDRFVHVMDSLSKTIGEIHKSYIIGFRPKTLKVNGKEKRLIWVYGTMIVGNTNSKANINILMDPNATGDQDMVYEMEFLTPYP